MRAPYYNGCVQIQLYAYAKRPSWYVESCACTIVTMYSCTRVRVVQTYAVVRRMHCPLPLACAAAGLAPCIPEYMRCLWQSLSSTPQIDSLERHSMPCPNYHPSEPVSPSKAPRRWQTPHTRHRARPRCCWVLPLKRAGPRPRPRPPPSARRPLRRWRAAAPEAGEALDTRKHEVGVPIGAGGRRAVSLTCAALCCHVA